MRSPLIGICIFFIIGILFANLINLSFVFIYIFTIIFFIISLLFLKFNFKFNLFIFISFFLLGICLFKNSTILPPNHIQKFITYKSKEVFLRGIVNDDPAIKETDYGKKTSFVLNVKQIKKRDSWQKTCGKILINYF